MTVFLKAYWRELICAATVLGLMIAVAVTTAQRDAARAQRDLANTRVAALSTQIDAQNDGIRKLAEAAKQNRDIYVAGLKAAEKRAIRLTLDADELLALPAPTNPDEACDAAAGVLRKVTQ